TLERVVPDERPDSQELTWPVRSLAAAPEQLRVVPVPQAPPAGRDIRSGGTRQAAENSQAARPARLRLTRRGRLTMTLVAAACTLGIAALAYSPAAAAPNRPAGAESTVVVVQPGDTVWEIARRADPQADPRATVARIVDLNDLSDGRISPGQRLRLPAAG
ncbi:MAG: LysM peptidoglycan-binding domain-containing protein, partial [Actinobacteria bacterium]|nr:LysM peptidoglycan-binding domain-containing protein [Actinomycetota bacterium]